MRTYIHTNGYTRRHIQTRFTYRARKEKEHAITPLGGIYTYDYLALPHTQLSRLDTYVLSLSVYIYKHPRPTLDLSSPPTHTQPTNQPPKMLPHLRHYSTRLPRDPRYRLKATLMTTYLVSGFTLPFVPPLLESRRSKRDGSDLTR